MNYQSYENVLEYLPNSNIPIHDFIYNESSNVFTTLKVFCNLSKTNTFVVSLSGGVDSMVLLSVLHYLRKRVIAVHINYNNRAETTQEEHFLKDWCQFNNIILYTKNISHITRESSKRSDYEEITKDIRFNLYKEIVKSNNVDGVLLAHHKDDTIENIFTNICRGRSILNLAVIKESSVIQDVCIQRPLLNVFKSEIYDFAHEHDIPYFKDTTPLWSIRGMYRNILLPKLQNIFGNKIKQNLLNFNQETIEWNTLISNQIIEPFLNQECAYHNKTVYFNVKKYTVYPLCFWNTVLMKVFYKYHHSCPSRKSIINFMCFIKSKTEGTINLSAKCKCVLSHGIIELTFS